MAIAFASSRFARTALALGLGLALAACETWMGENDGPPLPGKRISVLLHDSSLRPDAQTAGRDILLPEPSPNADWPQAGGYANHAMHHVEVGEALTRAWESSIGTGSGSAERLIAPPIVVNGTVFTIDAESSVRALDAQRGRKLWETDLAPRADRGHMPGGLAAGDGRIYATTGFAEIVALDPANGAVLWRQPVAGPMRAPPTYRSGRVFAVTLDNRTFALDASNGTQLWTHAGVPQSASLLGSASPAADAGVVVVAYSSGEIFALKLETGRVLWSDSLSATRRASTGLSDIRGRPVIDRGRVFAISAGDLMAAIDLRTGQRIWDRQIGGAESLWVAGDYLFAVTINAEVVALGRNDGRIHWATQLPRFKNEKKLTDPIIWSGPVLASDRLIVTGSHGEAWSLSPYTGETLGRVRMPDGVTVAPVVADRTIYFLADNARLVAYR